MAKKRKKKAGKGILQLILISLLTMIVTVFVYEQYRTGILHASKEAVTQTEQAFRCYTGKRSNEAPELPLPRSNREEQIISHQGYTVSYNAQWKLPNWVTYELTRTETSGRKKRTDRFIQDPQVKGQSAQNSDYSGSGYDRGHLAPAGDMKWSASALEESFYFSNICPQHPGLNRGDWKDLEEQIRRWAVKDSALIIACGPIMSRQPRTIGKNQVTVPDAFFKVILSPFVTQKRAIGFIFKNEKNNRPLKRYAVSVDSVERVTGMDFFAHLPDELEDRIEAHYVLSAWGIE